MAESSTPARLFVAGVAHGAGDPALLERIFVAEGAIAGTLAALRQAGIEQAIVLSTCDRVEVIGAGPDPSRAIAQSLDVLSARAGLTGEAWRRHAHALVDEAALRHVFALAAGLESQILGEPQILGQLKDAHRRAAEMGMLGRELEPIMQAAYAAAKRVRHETEIGQRPVSLAQAAVQLARDVHGALARARGLLIGTGEMGELLMEQLRLAGLDRVAVVALSLSRAEDLARRLSARIVPFEPLSAAVIDCDILVAASGNGRYVVTADLLESVQRARRHRPLFVIDVGIPADVEPAVERIDGVFRYDLDDLERATMAGRASRTAAAGPARAIVEEEIAGFLRHAAERAAVPAIIALRRHFEMARQQALRQAGGDAQRATELLVNRLLHDPTSALRRVAVQDGRGSLSREEVERLLTLLFRLDEGETSVDSRHGS